ncbi:nicotinate (nicotinamide) nucleotide adenylyltransferase [archaeon]|jgi:nicotinate-nucleotide adenylyltransferase|nr:nicotinate (nicotinamide) nucleotide adenylyltransferase [archaeon]MBT3577254.1 nicotinate (nicotinamide) nucleotide adenylyltransferase [archaeon]MBT6820504.1 nicotinate (nicotinamide) nucleotide adenylyltransferase [archaeon]MBT6956180.1 nicotinate (nicotinamide) nucleotide adenylyltransferase [archaeon]MBT7025754.1 nicotinate (nicotinamide) nucleotide adenylyltransferase [archaeon]
MDAESKKIGILGGSFNPIHKEHVRLIEDTLKNGLVDEIWALPCGNHAFGKDLVDGPTRVEMIKRSIEHIPNTKIEEIELQSEEKSYMIDTIKKLKEIHPHKFFLIVGSDIPSQISRWNKYEELINEIEFIVFKRPGYPITNEFGMKIAGTITSNPDSTSSTEIRERIKNGKTFKEFLPSNIVELIKQKGLYK